MVNISPKTFTRDRQILDDGTVIFKCDSDLKKWPWLALPPHDPIVVQMINFFVSVEAGIARGSYDPTKWSALTQTDWVCGTLPFGHATHGIAENIQTGDEMRFRITLFDASGLLTYRMSGTGVVFRTRNFEAWREQSKRKVRVAYDDTSFTFADAAAVGVAQQIESFLAPLPGRDARATQALITKQSGMPPAHPYLDGSGDHVNSTHIVDIGRQFVRLVSRDPGAVVLGGEMRFSHYVELDQPFDVKQSAEPTENGSLGIEIIQFDRLCAKMQLHYAGS